jgi:hypothetical protein
MQYVKEIMFGLTMLATFLCFYAIFQWRKWERCYWQLRDKRDPEASKKTVVMPYKLKMSKYND